MTVKRIEGYTLIETLVSLLIGMIAFAGLTIGLNSGYLTATDTRYHIYAQNAVREELETIREADYDAIVALGDVVVDSGEGNDQLNMIPGAQGSRTWADVPGADENIKKVTITVTWPSRSGRELSHSISTNITRNGLNGS